MSGDAGQAGVRLTTIAREWGRIGCIGFGGPPTHIALLRRLCVEERKWLAPTEFEDAIAATNLLPGPASTQLAIYSAWRLRGTAGALVGGVCFIVPGLVVILGLAAFFLSGGVPRWALGAAAGAGAAVAAVAVHAGVGLAPASWQRAGTARAARLRWIGYLLAGGLAAALTGPWLVLVLVAAGGLEVVVRTGIPGRSTSVSAPLPLAITVPALGGLAAVSWVAFKVGALSYGGGFVIIPLMQSDAVTQYHWMTDAQFLNAVALGQITPGPVVQTVAAVGYAAAGLPGGLLAALVAFAPSFLFILCGGPHFDRLRTNPRVLAFLSGAGPAVIGAILGSAIPLTLALQHAWQFAVLAAAALWLVAARRGVVGTLLSAAAIGVAAAAVGLPIT
ncbi:chromate efflux transporter [Nocardia tengchongensis]|uniref:chromate efflux transporter n=1 Tax=Nocardia tengchongensis TaxID=2055889 RepID=UPI00367405EB